MVYSFDTEIAQRFGVNEAILIQNIAYWIRKNEANDKHFHDGRYWTYNSAEAFAELFPFWSVNQIRRLLSRLVEIGVLIKGNYNASQYDRTAWYGFADSYLQNCKIHFANLQNGDNEITKCNSNIIDEEANINTNNKPIYKAETPKRNTIENLCLFSDSKFAKFEDFEAQFTAPEYADIDMYYYWQVIMDWSASKANKKRDWIATARNWIRTDKDNGKLHLKKKTGVALSPEAIHYLEMCGGLFDE